MSQRSVDPLAVIRRLVLTISFLAGPLLCPAHAADAVVPGDFSTIQAAIDAVINGTLPDGASIDRAAIAKTRCGAWTYRACRPAARRALRQSIGVALAYDGAARCP